VLVVTHDPRTVAFADRIIHIEDGLIDSDTSCAPTTGHDLEQAWDHADLIAEPVL
jgi:ABC-type lipoprotein export system ATPase subunit